MCQGQNSEKYILCVFGFCVLVCWWLYAVLVLANVCVCVCVCVREREREKERECTECVCASYECIDIYLLPSHHQTPPKDFSSVPTALRETQNKNPAWEKKKKKKISPQQHCHMCAACNPLTIHGFSKNTHTIGREGVSLHHQSLVRALFMGGDLTTTN